MSPIDVTLLRSALLSAVCVALALPGVARADTTTVSTTRELARLARKSKLSGSWVIDVPGVHTISLPKLQRVQGRLDFATRGLRAVELPALQEVGSDLFVGCDAPPRQEWERLGPIRPLEQVPAPSRGFEFEPTPAPSPASAASPSAPSGALSLPALTRVGGGFAVCSPDLGTIDAPALTEVGTDLQLFAGSSWSRVDLSGVARVRSRVFVWLADPDLTLDLSGLTAVDGSTQLGGVGTLRADLGALVNTAALIITGSRATAGDGPPAPRPSLSVPDLRLDSLERASQMIALRTVADLGVLSLPNLTRTDRLTLHDLPGLTDVSAPTLAQVAGDVTLSALPSLSTPPLLGLTMIGGDLQIAQLPGPSLELPSIEAVSGSVTVSELRSVRVLQLPRLRTAGAVRITGAGLIELLEFAALEEVRGPFVIEGDLEQTTGGALAVLSAPRLRVILGDDEQGLRIAQATLSSVRLPALERIAGPLVLVDLPDLTELLLPRLQEVAGRALVGGAPGLTALSLPGLVRADGLELAAMPGLARLFAPRLKTELKQSGGTRIARVEMPASER